MRSLRLGIPLLIAALLIVAVPPPDVQAQSPTAESVLSAKGTKVIVNDTGKAGFWRTLARVATLGIVQTPVIVQANKPFDVAFDHDAVDTDGYRLWVNGQISRNATLAQSGIPAGGGVGKFIGVTLARGSYTLHATAFNATLESDPSNLLAVTSQPGKPKPPANVRKDGAVADN